jgi:hypothetical protein
MPFGKPALAAEVHHDGSRSSYPFLLVACAVNRMTLLLRLRCRRRFQEEWVVTGVEMFIRRNAVAIMPRGCERRLSGEQSEPMSG